MSHVLAIRIGRPLATPIGVVDCIGMRRPSIDELAAFPPILAEPVAGSVRMTVDTQASAALFRQYCVEGPAIAAMVIEGGGVVAGLDLRSAMLVFAAPAFAVAFIDQVVAAHREAIPALH